MTSDEDAGDVGVRSERGLDAGDDADKCRQSSILVSEVNEWDARGAVRKRREARSEWDQHRFEVVGRVQHARSVCSRERYDNCGELFRDTNSPVWDCRSVTALLRQVRVVGVLSEAEVYTCVKTV